MSIGSLRLSAERGLVYSRDPGKSDHAVTTGHRDFNKAFIFLAGI